MDYKLRYGAPESSSNTFKGAIDALAVIKLRSTDEVCIEAFIEIITGGSCKRLDTIILMHELKLVKCYTQYYIHNLNKNADKRFYIKLIAKC